MELNVVGRFAVDTRLWSHAKETVSILQSSVSSI
jgi:hypothetical protein